jgi:ABC-2 type transport system permease protein
VVALSASAWSIDSWTRLAIWIAALLAYGAFWLAFAVLVSVFTTSSGLSAVVATVGWLAFVIVVPALVALSEPLLVPASTSLSYATAERVASLEINPRIDAATAALNRFVRKQFAAAANASLDRDDPTFTEPIALPVGRELLDVVPQPPWSPVMPSVKLSRALLEARRTMFERRLANVISELDAKERQHDAFVRIARFGSPALLFQSVTDDVAGTGRDRWTQFLSQLDDYIRGRETFFTRRILDGANISSRDFATLRPFRFREEDTSAMIARVALPLAALVAITGALAGACASVCRRWR